MNNTFDEDDFLDQLASDAAAPRAALPTDFIGRCTTLAKLLIDQERAVEQAEQALLEAKEAARRTREEDLPNLMREGELLEFKLEDGSTVTVDDDLTCTITEANRGAAFGWLAEHELDGVIKTSIILSFGKDERDAALKVAQSLRDAGHEPELKEGVHPQTLKSLMKEQLAAGVAVPFEPFSLRPFSKAKVKPPTKAAAKKAAVRKQVGLK